MKKIEAEVTDHLIRKKVAQEFEKIKEKRFVSLLTDLRQKILKVEKIEKTAFEELSRIIK